MRYRTPQAADPDVPTRRAASIPPLFGLAPDGVYPADAVAGAAVAGGCGLATACDFVLAEPDARFSYTEVRIGFIPAIVSTFLARRVGLKNVRRLLLNPEMLSAADALAIGLADEVVPAGSAVERAQELAMEISRKASPSAIAATKKLLNDTIGMEWREALGHAAEANVSQRMEPECLRGVRYFLEHKSTPDWTKEPDEDSA